MANAFVNPRIQLFTNNGSPLVGGRIHTFIAGTNTRAITYKDASKDQPNSNPIVLDGRGEAAIYLAEGVEYKFVIEDSKGVLLYSQEPVYGATWQDKLRADLYGVRGASMIKTLGGRTIQQRLDGMSGEIDAAGIAAAKVAAHSKSSDPHPEMMKVIDGVSAATIAATKDLKNQAESARDAAALAAMSAPGIYATETDGRAAVENGKTFLVQGSAGVAATVYRRTSPTTQDLVTKVPSIDAIEDLDSLKVNRGKAYPLLQKIRGGVSSPINAGFANFLLDISVIGGDPSKVYQISQFTNGHEGLNSRWMITEFTSGDFSSGAAGTVIKYVADDAPEVDRTQSVQKIAIDTRVAGLVFILIVSPAALPPLGTRLNVQSPSHDGYSWVIHPSCLMSSIEKSAINNDALAEVEKTNKLVEINAKKNDGFFNAPENRANRLQRALQNPFEAVRIRLVGDSITWGRSASNNTATEPRTGHLTDPRNTTSVSSPTWANLLRNWLAHSYGDGVCAEDAPGSGSFVVETECAILGGNKHQPTWRKGIAEISSDELSIVENSSSKTGRYIDLSTADGIPDSFEFTTTVDEVDVYFAGLSDRPQEQRKLNVYVDGALQESFYAYNSVATWNMKHTIYLDGARRRIKIALAEGSASARIIGLTSHREIRVANDGIIGSSVNSWLARNLLPNALTNDDTHLLVQLGTNDRVQSGASVDKFSKDLDVFIQQIKALRPDVDVTLLVANAVTQSESDTSVYKFKMRDVDNVVRQAAAKNNFGFLSQYTRTMQAKIDGEVFVPDLLHPNDFGHKIMFENIRDNLLR